MPILPSGRRIEFSLDRFQAMLGQMKLGEARRLVAALDDPDDLLYVMDVVEEDALTGQLCFCNKVASDFESYALGWPHDDQEALAAWIESASARHYRAAAIADLKSLVRTLDAQASPCLEAA